MAKAKPGVDDKPPVVAEVVVPATAENVEVQATAPVENPATVENVEVQAPTVSTSEKKPVAPETPSADVMKAEAGRWRFYCHAPTPLAENPFECEAESEAEALKKFFFANGITGTSSKIDIDKTR
jgi:hypothetical protein